MLPDLPRKHIGRRPDGTPDKDYHEYFAPEDHEACIVYTGPALGLVQLSDGTLYDVTRHYIEVECEGHNDDEGVTPVGKCHASEVNHHIALQHENSGRFDSIVPETGEVIKFQHTDCPHCDAPKTLHLETPAERTAAARVKPAAAPAARHSSKAGA